MTKKTILLCTTPSVRPVLLDAFSNQFNLVFAYSINEAKIALKARVDAVGCGIYFADNHSFDLLKWVKETPDLMHIPFFMADASSMQLTLGIAQSIEGAIRALGGDGFLPLNLWRRELGDEQAFQKIRDAYISVLK